MTTHQLIHPADTGAYHSISAGTVIRKCVGYIDPCLATVRISQVPSIFFLRVTPIESLPVSNMPSSNGHVDSSIDKRDFDTHRPLLHDGDIEGTQGETTPEPRRSRAGSRRSRLSASSGRGAGSDEGLLNDVVEEIVERDRRKMHREVVRAVSFAWGVITW